LDGKMSTFGEFGEENPWGGLFGLFILIPPDDGGGDGGGVGPDQCITDHRGQALDLLVTQFRGKPNIEALISAFVAPIQRLEDSLCQLLHERSLPVGEQPATAVGEQLNVIGRIVGFRDRSGRSDADYLRLIQAMILANRSNGTVEEFINITILVTGISTGIVIQRQNVATLLVRPTGGVILPDAADFLMRFLARSVSGGIRMILEFFPQLESLTFAFSGGTGLGFGDGGFAGARSNGLSNQPVIL
jgi:hypothetical protein